MGTLLIPLYAIAAASLVVGVSDAVRSSPGIPKCAGTQMSPGDHCVLRGGSNAGYYDYQGIRNLEQKNYEEGKKHSGGMIFWGIIFLLMAMLLSYVCKKEGGGSHGGAAKVRSHGGGARSRSWPSLGLLMLMQMY